MTKTRDYKPETISDQRFGSPPGVLWFLSPAAGIVSPGYLFVLNCGGQGAALSLGNQETKVGQLIIAASRQVPGYLRKAGTVRLNCFT